MFQAFFRRPVHGTEPVSVHHISLFLQQEDRSGSKICFFEIGAGTMYNGPVIMGQSHYGIYTTPQVQDCYPKT